MDEELISKKDLLELTDISYGQLYRWKRKNLIPEDWFVRKSTFTGQETFFPRNKILARIEKIKNMKDDLSLDQLADMFSPGLVSTSFTKEELVKRNIVINATMDIFAEYFKDTGSFSFEKILYAYVIDQLLQTGDISLEEAKILLQTLDDHYPSFQGRNCELIFMRKLGISTCLLSSSPSEVFFEKGARIVFRMNLANSIEELKIKISEG